MKRFVRSLRRMAGSVRLRVTLMAGVAFALALITVSILLVHTLQSRLVSDLRSSNDRALQSQVTTLLTAGLPSPTASQSQSVVTGTGTVSFQVGASDGKAIVATATRAAGGSTSETTAAGTSPDGAQVTGPGPVQNHGATGADLDTATIVSADGVVGLSASRIDPDSARLLGVAGQSGPFLVSAIQVYPGLSLTTASSLAEVESTLSTTRTILWYTVPALILLVMGFA
ncbi:MAG TPA: hypothetical protein VGM78_08545, partial [Ilumatobacteraceae bacterium]